MASGDTPKVTLYWLSQSRSQRIVWLLEELKIPYEVEIYHRDKKTMLAPKALEKIHPLGKSPVVSVTPAGEGAKPIVLAESGFMTDYLCSHFPEGKRLVPTKWQPGKEDTVGGETEEWLRYQYFLHYVEGSLMGYLVMGLVISQLKSGAVPFFIRPITATVANRIFAQYIFPNAKRNIAFINQQLSTSSGKYLCGTHLTAADILISFPLIAAKDRFDQFGAWEGGSWTKEFPLVHEYVQRLENEPGYRKSVEKIEALDGEKFVSSL